MSRKNTLDYPVLINGSPVISLATSFTTPATLVNMLDNCSYQINVTTSNSQGSFTVEVSNDYNQSIVTNNVASNGTWSTLPIGGTPVVAATNDSIYIDINQVSFKAMRVRYTSTTPGTGTCAIELLAKSIGA